MEPYVVTANRVHEGEPPEAPPNSSSMTYSETVNAVNTALNLSAAYDARRTDIYREMDQMGGKSGSWQIMNGRDMINQMWDTDGQGTLARQVKEIENYIGTENKDR